MSEQLSRAVAAEIRRRMDAQGVTAYAIWKATEIPQTSLSRKLRGQTAFDLDDVQKIAGVLGIEPEQLIADARLRTGGDPME